MHRSRKLSLLIATAILAGLFAVACDSGTQEPDAPDTSTPLESGDTTDSQSNSATPSTAMPDGGAVDIPEEFPKALPIYPGAIAAQGKGTVSEGVPMAAVQLNSSDTPEEVYDFYMDKLGRDGWTIEEREGLEGKNSVSATNGECTATMLAAPNEEGGTLIFVFTEC